MKKVGTGTVPSLLLSSGIAVNALKVCKSIIGFSIQKQIRFGQHDLGRPDQQKKNYRPGKYS